jgi:hypothetical protein
MLKRTLVALVTLLVTTAAFAGKYPLFINDVVKVQVGQTVEAEVFAGHTGFADYPNVYSWIFSSVDHSVANVSGKLYSPNTRAKIRVTGLAPGFSWIVTGSYPGARLARIIVSCGEQAPVVAANPEVSARLNEEVALTTASADLDRTTFTWYRGRLGDTSQPLDASGPAIQFAADSTGDHYVWVSAMSACSTSRAEFHVEVIQPRRRGAGR